MDNSYSRIDHYQGSSSLIRYQSITHRFNRFTDRRLADNHHRSSSSPHGSSSDSETHPASDSSPLHDQQEEHQKTSYSSSASVASSSYSDAGDPLARLRLSESRRQPRLRHGFDDRHPSGEYLEGLLKPHSVYWDDSPYKTIKPSDLVQIPYWTQPPKHRTACAALFLCLRLGFDPPDVVKTTPAPKLEAWIDPSSLPKETVLDSIARRLQDQFESLAPTHARVKFKTYADVYAEEFKKTLIGLRKYSRSDRCLIYYNGHGVPKPTPTGEIWVFNKAYTQYIPISVSDILSWVGPPVVFIWDCNNAGHILNSVITAGRKKDDELAHEIEIHQQVQQNPHPPLNAPDWNPTPLQQSANPVAVAEGLSTHAQGPASGRTSPSVGRSPVPNVLTQNTSLRYSDTIQLAACGPDEMLPLDPNLPADVFTSCLTSPIEMALRFYVLRNNSDRTCWTTTAPFFRDLPRLSKVPGSLEMRRTPLGELAWIFTAIADAIAWNHLDRQLFTKIFRGDLVLAGTFRGYLLAERVLKYYGCTPMSKPQLPTTNHSELWQTWDLEVDMCLTQLLEIWESESIRAEYENDKIKRLPNSLPPQIISYKPSAFFSQQLTAFELWLKTVVAENPVENGDNDEDCRRRRETLRWSCNDWSGVKMNEIDITDFSCTDPAQLHKQKPSSSASKAKSHTMNTTEAPRPPSSHPKNRAISSEGVNGHNPSSSKRPIRYKLPTYIKHFPLNSRKADDLYPPSPPQLPIVLQVLLSPLHRLRALILLCRLMDLGPWAVHLSLSIGIFQYVLKLLQAPAADLKPVLIFIWARILTVYPDGRQDLFRFHMNRQNAPPDAPIEYFIKVMAPHSMELPIINVVDHKAMCAFILSIGCKNSRANSKRLMQFGVMEIIMHRIKELIPWQRQWYLILLAHMWEDADAVKGRAIKMGVNTVLSDLLTDKVPEVRTAALYAFGTLIGVCTNPRPTEIQDDFPDGYNANSHSQNLNLGIRPGQANPASQARPINLEIHQMNKLNSLSSSNPLVTGLGYQEQISIEVGSAMACSHCSIDGSPMFRQELIVVLSALVDQHLGHFIVAAFEYVKQKEKEKYMQTIDLIKRYRNSRWGPKEKDGEVDWEELEEVEQLMTDRASKLERLIAKLRSDEDPQESLRAYLWMEYSNIYIVLLDLTLDASEEVADMAKTVVDYIHSRLIDSVLGSRLGLDELIDEDVEQIDRQEDSNTHLSLYGFHSQTDLKKFSSSSGSINDRKGLNGNTTRSTASMFQTLSTVNNLVPNFVKSSGWKTPFNALSRSPEQATFNTGGPSTDEERTKIRKSASLNPIVLMTNEEGATSKLRVPLKRMTSNDSSDTSTEPPTMRLQSESNEKRNRLGTSQTIPTIISKTREADHIRRQVCRSYPLQGNSVSRPKYVGKNLGEENRTAEEEEESMNEELEYYLGLQDIEGLKDELNDEGMKRKLPLRSNYYELSSHTFLKPKMPDSIVEDDDVVINDERNGIEAIKCNWRTERNQKIISYCQDIVFDTVKKNWQTLNDSWHQSSPITNLAMHRFEPHIITSDTAGYITVYESGEQEKLNRFRNSAGRPTRITSLELINEEDVGLVLTGTADGNIRIFRNYDRPDKTQMVTAFKGLPNNEPSTYSDSGVVTDWQQSTGLLVVGGNSRDIKIWNSRRESCIENIKTRANSCLTSITSDHINGYLIFGGFGDGSLRVFDRRESLKNSMVKVYRGFHSTWIDLVKIQEGGQRDLISGDSIGEICQWDIRLDKPIRMFKAQADGMPSLAVHDHQPILASGSMDGIVKLWDLNYDDEYYDDHHLLQIQEKLTNHECFGKMNVSNWGKPISSLKFHPYAMKICTASGDGSVKVYSV